MTISRLLSWSVLSMSCLAAVPAAAIEYNFAILPTTAGQPAGDAESTGAYAISNTGQVAGWSRTPEQGEVPVEFRLPSCRAYAAFTC